jgi:NADH-ubiquinone oxidoreductase chain 1
LESELVSGFMTEHAAVIFVFFFLAEYASIVLICILTSILFLGGYLITIIPIYYIMYIYEILSTIIFNVSINISQIIDEILNFNLDYYISKNEINLNPVLNGLLPSIVLGLKSCLMIFVFI